MTISIKEKILYSANKVIEEKGLNAFTLDEVAKEAGISKGGLLHYYSNKESLIRVLIEKYVELFERSIQGDDDESNSNWLISYIQEQYNQSKIDTNTMYGLLAAVASNQNLLQPVLDKRKQWVEKINKTKDPVLALIISFACDGIAFSNLLGLDVLDECQKSKLVERLISLVKECY
ncbi:TetR/AcrR family transcriptional regulator [Clostridium sp. C8-1-8]|uniref:TetR/AcrR family transcriptional regulator n=1 Tax=Clostridium sp. C8-1-8 TaxID=2698831 RepID=UPI001368D92A|nr:TetR/AcrR family transcriptional regulator [Clostridium sp. C8-1-8]